LHFTIEQRVENFKRYYAFENARPLVGFFMESEYPVDRYKASQTLPEDRPLKPEDFICNDYLPDCERLFNVHEAAGGDFIWSASPFWGIPWLEACLGCEIYTLAESGSLHAEKHKTFSLDPVVPKFDPSEPWTKKAIEFIKLIAEHSNNRYPIATPRLRGIADLLAALYGNEMFIFKLMEDPDHIKKVCEDLTDYWIAFAKHLLKYIPLFHGGVGSFYYNMWAPADSIWHQEDATALLSPDLYRKFIEPCDYRIADSFAGCFMHMHPTDYYPYKELLNSDMTCLELHIDAGGPAAQQLFEVHKEILNKKPLLIWGQIQEKDLNWIFNNLPSPGLAVNIAVDNNKQAETIWQKYIRS